MKVSFFDGDGTILLEPVFFGSEPFLHGWRDQRAVCASGKEEGGGQITKRTRDNAP